MINLVPSPVTLPILQRLAAEAAAQAAAKKRKLDNIEENKQGIRRSNNLIKYITIHLTGTS